MIVFAPLAAEAKPAAPEPVVVASGWQLQDAAKVPQSGAEVAAAAFNTTGWYTATVPGTVLTTVVTIPQAYAGKHIWLNFNGINYSASIWVDGAEVGTTRGAFIRGKYDISYNVKPGKKAVIAVLVSPQPHPGVPHEHTLTNGVGLNGGITAIDGPTL